MFVCVTERVITYWRHTAVLYVFFAKPGVGRFHLCRVHSLPSLCDSKRWFSWKSTRLAQCLRALFSTKLICLWCALASSPDTWFVVSAVRFSIGTLSCKLREILHPGVKPVTGIFFFFRDECSLWAHSFTILKAVLYSLRERAWSQLWNYYHTPRVRLPVSIHLVHNSLGSVHTGNSAVGLGLLPHFASFSKECVLCVFRLLITCDKKIYEQWQRLLILFLTIQRTTTLKTLGE